MNLNHLLLLIQLVVVLNTLDQLISLLINFYLIVFLKKTNRRTGALKLLKRFHSKILCRSDFTLSIVNNRFNVFFSKL